MELKKNNGNRTGIKPVLNEKIQESTLKCCFLNFFFVSNFGDILLKFTVINANAHSFSTFDFPLTENRENDKTAFRNPKLVQRLFYVFYICYHLLDDNIQKSKLVTCKVLYSTWLRINL